MHVLPVTQSTVSLKEQLEILMASTQIDGQVKNLMHKNADPNQGKRAILALLHYPPPDS